MILHVVHILYCISYLQNILVYHCLKSHKKEQYAQAKVRYSEARKRHLQEYMKAKADGAALPT
jgi:hypothetical protein